MHLHRSEKALLIFLFLLCLLAVHLLVDVGKTSKLMTSSVGLSSYHFVIKVSFQRNRKLTKRDSFGFHLAKTLQMAVVWLDKRAAPPS